MNELELIAENIKNKNLDKALELCELNTNSNLRRCNSNISFSIINRHKISNIHFPATEKSKKRILFYIKKIINKTF